MECYTYDKNVIDNNINIDDVVNCKVLNYDRNFNLIVEFGKEKGIIEREDISIYKDSEFLVPQKKIIGYLNKTIKVKLKDIKNEGEYKYSFSRKDIELETNNWITNNLEKDMAIKGRIINIQNYGVFVEVLNDFVGLLHIQDISVARIRHPLERFKIGQNVDVKIKSYDKKTGHILLSQKELLGTWEDNIKNFQEGIEVTGIAREKEKNGIFIELTPNLVGLAEHKFGIQYGQKVNVYIKKIVPEKRKVKLVIV